MATKRKACPRESNRLGKLVLPEKESLGNILTELRSSVNPCEVADDILGPFYEMMGRDKRGVR